MTPVDTASNSDAAVRLADFADSDMFARLFREGMDLVEETANYLDGPGREDAKRLGRSAALSYAAQSMTLTTQLMQCASWLLTQRAVGEGEMSAVEASQERYRLTPSRLKDANWPEGEEPCPAHLAELTTRAKALHERLTRLDRSLFDGEGDSSSPGDNPVASQLSMLNQAFGR